MKPHLHGVELHGRLYVDVNDLIPALRTANAQGLADDLERWRDKWRESNGASWPWTAKVRT